MNNTVNDLLEQELLQMTEEKFPEGCGNSPRVVEHHTKILSLLAKIAIDTRHTVNNIQGSIDNLNDITINNGGGKPVTFNRNVFFQNVYDKLSFSKQLKNASGWIETGKSIVWAVLAVGWLIYSIILYNGIKQEKINIAKEISEQLKELSVNMNIKQNQGVKP